MQSCAFSRALPYQVVTMVVVVIFVYGNEPRVPSMLLALTHVLAEWVSCVLDDSMYHLSTRKTS
jgi:hypothetical protein